MTITEDPAFQAAVAEGAGGPKATGDPNRATLAAMGAPAGRTFLQKLEKIETIMADAQGDMMAELAPGAFRRFGEKAEAAERARQPGS